MQNCECKAVCLCIITNRKVHQPCKTGDRLIIFKDHDIKGRSVLFDSSVPVDNSQQKEPAAVSSAAFILYCSMVLCLQCFDAVGWAAGRASACKKLSGGVLAWLSV